MPRIVVIGGPRVGKTTYATKLARQLGIHLASTGKRTESESGLVSTDNWMKKASWNDLPDHIINDLKQRENFILEGTQAARVLRRWIREDPDGPKLDKVLVFNRPWVKRNVGQEAMAKGVKTVLRELLPLLQRAGVTVEHMTPPEMTEDDWREHRSSSLAAAAEAERDGEAVDEMTEAVQDT